MAKAWFVVVQGTGVDVPSADDGERALIGFFNHAYVWANSAEDARTAGLADCRDGWARNAFRQTNRAGEPSFSVYRVRRAGFLTCLFARMKLRGRGNAGASWYAHEGAVAEAADLECGLGG